jgi:hypothetical protein
MPRAKRGVPSPRRVKWRTVGRRATAVFFILRAGWSALTAAERDEARRLLSQSRGRPHNLTRADRQRLGRLAGKAAKGVALRRRH